MAPCEDEAADAAAVRELFGQDTAFAEASWAHGPDYVVVEESLSGGFGFGSAYDDEFPFAASEVSFTNSSYNGSNADADADIALDPVWESSSTPFADDASTDQVVKTER